MIQSAVQSVKSTLSTNPSIGTCYTARFGLDKRLVPPPQFRDSTSKGNSPHSLGACASIVVRLRVGGVCVCFARIGCRAGE